MIKITSLSVTGALLAFGFSAAPAQAGPNRTWVSGHGTDSGGCPVTAPCRTFAFALTQTAAGGEIDVLEPAGYGPVTITKSISIVNDGVGTAAIGVESGNAITINASGLFDFVHLRGLTIEGHPGFGVSVGNGIQFNSGLNLAIENCVIRNVGFGINISPSTASSFLVSNTIASNTGIGIAIAPNGPAVVTGVLSKVITNNNGVGIGVNASVTPGASLNVTVVDSVASNNNNVGINAFLANTVVMVRNSVASNNGTGLFAQRNAILRVAHSAVTGNFLGVQTTSGGTLFSYGNTNDNTGVLTPLAMH
jgi:hypothetical protein